MIFANRSRFNIFFCCVFLLIVFQKAFAEDAPGDPIKAEKERYEKLVEMKYVLLPHRGTYILPIVFNSIPHEEIYSGMTTTQTENGSLYRNVEAEFQVSFLVPVERRILGTNFDLNFAYTHHAWWQVYNADWSRPFRETNYMPEIFIRHIDKGDNKILGFDFLGGDIGYIHQSNGQIQLISRSWNRIYARAYFQNQGYLINLGAWVRVPEKSNQDDNSDIYDYMGFGEVELVKSFGKHAMTYKIPLFSKYYSADMKYSFPWRDRLRWFVSVQFGYGHSLIEYNRPTERYGIGISLDSLLTQDHDKKE